MLGVPPEPNLDPEENAEDLAQLRVIRANNLWEDFWKTAA